MAETDVRALFCSQDPVQDGSTLPLSVEGIEVGLRATVLDLVNPWLQFSALEDAEGICGHGQQSKFGDLGNKSAVQILSPSAESDMRPPHFYPAGDARSPRSTMPVRAL